MAPRGRHGLLLSEATDPKNRGKFKVPLPITDFAQKALDDFQDRYKREYPDADTNSLRWLVELVD